MRKINHKEEGDKFHKKVEKMFQKLLPSSIKSYYHKKGSDIVVDLDQFKILIQCKNSNKKKKYTGLQTLIDSYSRKVQKECADVAVLAFSGYQIPLEYIRNKKKILQEDKVAIWSDKVVKSYDQLISSIGEYAKYQILGNLNLSSGNKPTFVKALSVQQKNQDYYIATLTPSFLLKAGYVARRIEDPKTYQRFIARVRVRRDIPMYLDKDIGLFPNSIILISDYPLKFEKGKLKLFERPASLKILDGQHRLYGFTNVEKSNLRENYDLICTIFDGTKDKKFPVGEQANLFTKINNESKKVPFSLLLELSKTYEEVHSHKREIKIMKELEKTKIFKNRFKGYQDDKGSINITAFCTNKAMQQLIRKNTGLLFRNVTNHSENFEIKRCVFYIKHFFRIIVKNFKKEWNNPPKYILCTDRGIMGLLYFFIKILKYSKYHLNRKEFNRVVKILKSKNPELRNDKLKRKYLGEGGALEMANDFALRVNEEIEDFDPTLVKDYGKPLEIKQFWRGQKEDAKQFILKCTNKYFEDKLYAKLMHVDETTFILLKELCLKCKNMEIIFQDMKNKKKCAEQLQKMRANGITIILTKKRVHERWIATYKYLLKLELDLKEDAICNNDHDKTLYKLGPDDDTIKRFKEIWEFAKQSRDEKILYDYNPEIDLENIN